MDVRTARSIIVSVGLALVVGLGVIAAPVAAADPTVSFDTPSASSTFAQGTVWKQTFQAPTEPRRVELMTRLVGTDPWLVQEVPFSAAKGDMYEVAYPDASFQLPNSRVEYRFRVTPRAGPAETGPTATLLVVDDRLDWRTLDGDLVRIHWASGDKAFAERALRIAEDSIAATSKLLGVTESEPIDFFVYADPDQFQSALGPGTKEFVAGRAVPEIRTLFGRILPDQIGSDWVPLVIGHELAHLVFDTATHNPYHEPPHWMNEGLATYLTDGYSDEWRQRVSNAVERGTLLPLTSITDGFPSDREELFYLGYGEGASAIDFFVRTYGQEKLVQLIRSYATGVTDDEAFTTATGEGFAAFEAAWLADLGTAAPKAQGPRDAEPGPTPAAWAGAPTSATGQGGVLPAGPGAGTWSTASTAVAVALLVAAALLLLVAVGLRRRRQPAGRPLDATASWGMIAQPPSWGTPVGPPGPPSGSARPPSSESGSHTLSEPAAEPPAEPPTGPPTVPPIVAAAEPSPEPAPAARQDDP